MIVRKSNFSILSLTSDLFMTFYRVVLYARMVLLLLLYTLTTTSIVTQSLIFHLSSRPDQGNLHELTQSTLPFSNEIGAAV